jgi:hypothetical protein
VSLLRALTDDVGEKVMQAAHLRAVQAAMPSSSQRWSVAAWRAIFRGAANTRLGRILAA